MSPSHHAFKGKAFSMELRFRSYFLLFSYCRHTLYTVRPLGRAAMVQYRLYSQRSSGAFPRSGPTLEYRGQTHKQLPVGKTRTLKPTRLGFSAIDVLLQRPGYSLASLHPISCKVLRAKWGHSVAVLTRSAFLLTQAAQAPQKKFWGPRVAMRLPHLTLKAYIYIAPDQAHSFLGPH